MHDRLLTHQDALAPVGPLPPRRRPRASTSSASRTTCAGAATRRASPRTSAAPTPAASPARRRSSSTAAATWASTTSRRCARGQGRGPRARPHRSDGDLFGLGRFELGVLGRRGRGRQFGERFLEVAAAAVAGDAGGPSRRPSARPGRRRASSGRSPASPCRPWPRGRRRRPVRDVVLRAQRRREGPELGLVQPEPACRCGP